VFFLTNYFNISLVVSLIYAVRCENLTFRQKFYVHLNLETILVIKSVSLDHIISIGQEMIHMHMWCVSPKYHIYMNYFLVRERLFAGTQRKPEVNCRINTS